MFTRNRGARFACSRDVFTLFDFFPLPLGLFGFIAFDIFVFVWGNVIDCSRFEAKQSYDFRFKVVGFFLPRLQFLALRFQQLLACRFLIVMVSFLSSTFFVLCS